MQAGLLMRSRHSTGDKHAQLDLVLPCLTHPALPESQSKDLAFRLYIQARHVYQQKQPREERILKYLLKIEDLKYRSALPWLPSGKAVHACKLQFQVLSASDAWQMT